jgi:hypothetical protein
LSRPGVCVVPVFVVLDSAAPELIGLILDFFALLSAFCNYVVLSVVPEDGEAGGRLEGIVLLDAEAELVLQVRAERHSQQESSGRQQEFQHEKEHNQAEILVNI